MKQFLKSFLFRMMAAVSALLIGLMIYAATTGGAATIPETLVGAVVTPIQSLFAALSDGIGEFTVLFSDSGRLTKEMAEKDEIINELRKQSVESDEIRRQLELYKAFLELKERKPDLKFAEGRVVAMEPSDKYYNFTVNAGTRDGVEAGNPVITPAGLVGVVYEAGLTFSKVRTILDPATQISVWTSGTHDGGMLSGSRIGVTDSVRMTRLDRNTGAVSGDIIITLGGGKKYPADLMVGQITEVYAASDGLSLSATVKPFADISKLSDVFVIIGFAEKDELE
ncbi:MAG: rod shape-determining protein MreC [Oscillospiraceae bacterium]|nr:rod shape-determining protein MreC [Oscillospiraceae bacterium]